MSTFVHRGVIEGFYGTPWSHGDRLWLLGRLGVWGMNRYVYAPKDDPLQRAGWREPYPPARLAEFEELIEAGGGGGVEVGFALSPGRSISYASSGDRKALVEKFRAFGERGSGLVVLCLDDISSELPAADRSSFATLADAHVALVGELRAGLAADVSLWLVPTDYLGVASTDYLERLGEGIDPEVEIAWTGRTVIPPTLTCDEASARAASLRRRVLVWDNVPVADGPMRGMLHLGPYTGRESGLPRYVSGILLNPMRQVRASAIVLRTAAAYMAQPDRYEPEHAWRSALAEAGEGAPAALELFARAHRFSPLWPEDRDTELESALTELRAALSRTDAEALRILQTLEAAVDARQTAEREVRAGLRDRRLLAELEPWLDSYAWETQRIGVSVRMLRRILGDEPRSRKLLAFMGFESGLLAPPASAAASYGPRRVLYPQLASMRDAEMGFGADPALFLGRCLTDEFVALVESETIARLGC